VEGLVASKDAMDVDDAEMEKVKDVDRDDVLVGAVSAASKAFRPHVLRPYLELIKTANSVQTRAVAVAVFQGLSDVAPKLKGETEEDVVTDLEAVFVSPLYAGYGVDAKVLRVEALGAWKDVGWTTVCTFVQAQVSAELEMLEPSERVQEEMRKARGK